MNIKSSNLDSYKVFAKYYRILANSRKHFETQAKILSNFIRSQQRWNNTTLRVLDAACGTGDVLTLLKKSFDDEIYLSGCDGSYAMLQLAKQIKPIRTLNLDLCRWEDLPAFFLKHGKFDIISMLGLSIPYLDRKHIPIIFRNAYSGLLTSGIFVFDTRFWKFSKNFGQLIESNRQLDRILVDDYKLSNGERLKIREKCDYADGLQYVYLQFKYDSKVEEICLSHTPFTFIEAKAWLLSAGFKHVEKYDFRPNWKYLVISART